MEIKNITKYNEELLKKFLKVYYFDKIKTVRIIMNILILIVVIRFFIKKDIDALDIITFIFALFGIIEINTNMLPQFNLYRIKKKKDSILNTKIKYLFNELKRMQLSPNKYKKCITPEKHFLTLKQ